MKLAVLNEGSVIRGWDVLVFSSTAAKSSLPYCQDCRRKMRKVTYRFSRISFVAMLPRLALLSLHTTDPVTTSCTMESQSIRSHLWTTSVLTSSSSPKQEQEHTVYFTNSSPAALMHLFPEETVYREAGLQEWYLMAVQGECHRTLFASPQQAPDASLLHYSLWGREHGKRVGNGAMPPADWASRLISPCRLCRQLPEPTPPGSNRSRYPARPMPAAGDLMDIW